MDITLQLAVFEQIPQSERDKSGKLLIKIFQNILEQPHNEKYRDLNFVKIIDKFKKCPICVDLIFSAGFETSFDEQRLLLKNSKPLNTLQSLHHNLLQIISNDNIKDHNKSAQSAQILENQKYKPEETKQAIILSVNQNNSLKCICGHDMIKAVLSKLSMRCMFCYNQGSECEIFWECNKLNDIHQQSFSLCNNCVSTFKSDQSLQFRFIDKLIAVYYTIMGIKDYENNGYGKFYSFIQNEGLDDDDLKISDELGDDCIAEDCSYIRFDPEFPIPIHLIQHVNKTKIMFYFLQFCHKYHRYPLPQRLRQQFGAEILTSNIEQKVDDKVRFHHLLNCEELKRLKNAINGYNNNKMENIDLTEILNDFLYLLKQQNKNDDFDFIYEQLGGFCDVNNCVKFQRNYRDRRKSNGSLYNVSKEDDCLRYILKYQILDRIHCYYSHSFDIGYRFNEKERVYLNSIGEKNRDIHIKNELNQMISNKQLFESFRILSSKQKSHRNEELNHTKSGKYCQASQYLIQSDQKKYNRGVLFEYGDDDKSEVDDGTTYKISAKYSSFKDEMLNNDMAVLTKEQFDSEYFKAAAHYDSYFRKENFPDIRSEYLLSLMIYCNYDYLQYKYSKTFRENIDEHDNFYYFGKYLKCAINEFGTEIGDGNVKKFYHGITEKLLFDKAIGFGGYGINIYSPLSTTPHIAVASNFTDQNNGLIIEFGAQERKFTEFSMYFSVSWLSDYVNEDEHLFVQNPYFIRINNIIDPKFGTEYGIITEALSILEYVTSEGKFRQKTITESMMVLIVKMIENQLSYKKPILFPSFETLNEYAKEVINVYCNNKSWFRMNVEYQTEYWWFFKLFLLESGWIKSEVIHTLFPTIEEINIENTIIKSSLIESILSDCYVKNMDKTLISIQNIKDAVDDDILSAQQAMTKYSAQFKSNGMFIFSLFNTITISTNQLLWVMEIIKAFGSAYFEDNDHSTSNMIKKLVNSRLSGVINDDDEKIFSDYCINHIVEPRVDWNHINSNVNCLHLREVLCHTDCDWIKLDVLRILYPRIITIRVRKINLRPNVMVHILQYLNRKTTEIKNIQIQIIPKENSDFSREEMIFQYNAQFNKIKYEISPPTKFKWRKGDNKSFSIQPLKT